MQTEPEHQYSYFLQLERTVKFALSVYGALLVTGILGIALGIDSILRDVASGNYRVLILFVFGTCGILLGSFTLLGKVRWLSKLNSRLDRIFFKVLDQSNAIVFDAIFESIAPDLQRSPTLLDDRRKQTFAQDIFRRMAGEDHHFQFLLKSNIFRLWIWYWIFLYGSFTFTLLTIGFFGPVALGVTVATKAVFTLLWILAIAHIGIGFFLGNHLIRVTHSTVNTMLDAHRDEIATMLKESIHALQQSTTDP